jgi:hypothetical protein
VSTKLFDSTPFAGYPESTKKFYTNILYMMALNDLAVSKGYFDVRLCDTNDMISWFRFVEMMPQLEAWLKIDKDIGNL